MDTENRKDTEDRKVNQVVNQVWWMLRAVFGVIPVVAGLDKFFNLLTPWEQYLSPLALRLSPVSAPALMRVFGIVEIAVGVMILTRWTRIGAYVASAWLLLIALNLLTMGRFLDVAARDVALAVTAFGLARLQEARTTAPAARRGAGVPRPVHG